MCDKFSGKKIGVPLDLNPSYVYDELDTDLFING